MHKYFIGLSVSELQQWLADDVLPVLTGRIAHSRMHTDAASLGSVPESLFRTLPAFAPDDPAGVLIAEVSGPGTWREDDNPSIRCLPLSAVKRFIPLTEDARTALTLHLGRIIDLSPAIFEHEFTRFRISRKSIAANNAGNLFANLLINYDLGGYTADSVFADSLPRALMAAEHRKPDEIEELFGRQAGDLPETWVERAFSDIKPARNNQPVNLRNMPVSLRGIYMLGLLLASAETVEDRTSDVRAVWQILGKKPNGLDPSLAQVYAEPKLFPLEVRLDVAQKSSAQVSLVTLALFLHWKQAFHDQRSTVDAPSILKDVRSLDGLVKLEQVANALWMMGAYLGMEHIAPTYLYLHRKKYPALQFAGQEERLEPVRAWALKETASPPEQEPAAAFVCGAGAAGTPTLGSTSADNMGDSEEQQPRQQETKDIPEVTRTESRRAHVLDGAGPSTGQALPAEHSPAAHAVIIPQEAQTPHAGQAARTDNPASETPEQTEHTAPALPVAEVLVTSSAETPAAALLGAPKKAPARPPVPAMSEGDKEIGSVKSSQAGSKTKHSPGKSSKKSAPGRSTDKNGKGDATPKASASPAAVEEITPQKYVKTEVNPGEEGEGAPQKAPPGQVVLDL
jgi:hypothetical protein